MRTTSFRRSALLLGTAVCALSAASGAFAQAANNPPADGGSAALEEVVVTATRQVDTVNRVPLAVTAATQRTLDQRGIRTINDLQATVPGLRMTVSEPLAAGAGGAGVATISIRGVRQQAGAATTGFYLDETPLQKRNAAGFFNINGTPTPPLFDLDRVEVLRGPQGTLFGGGSEGGTVRYIQPQPSLTRYSTYARAQYMHTEHGDPTYEGGVAVGGPIVQDKLGFRASIFARKTGGFIDLVDYRNGRVYNENANEGKTRMGRLAVTWAPTEKSRITASYFSSTETTEHNSTTFTQDLGRLVVPSVCVDIPALTALPVGSNPRYTARPFAGGPSCNGRAGQPGIFVEPGYTIGPIDLKPYQSISLGPNPVTNHLQVASIDAEYRLTESLTFRSITSYVHDLGKAHQPSSVLQNNIVYTPAGGAIYTPPGGGTPIIIQSGITLNPNVTATPNGLGLGAAYAENGGRNKRYGLTQEFRISSNPENGWLSFVAGGFYSNTRMQVVMYQPFSELGIIQQSGMTTLQRFGIPHEGFYAQIIENDKDVEIAGFAEATARIGEHWRVTGGLRLTHITTEFYQTNFGPNGFVRTPQELEVRGSVSEDPDTPKASVQYVINSNDLLYATAAKGFRAGGVNPTFTATGRAALLAQYGLTREIVPPTYESDSVWSYELGGKFRLLNGRAQLNLAAYRIDWSNVQVTVPIGGDQFNVNAPSARSQGVEVEGQLRPFRNLTLNGAVAYSKSKYTSSYILPSALPGGLPLIAVQQNAVFPLPQWTADFGARYDVTLSSALRGYARVDFRWSEGYNVFPPGHPSYSPDSSIVPSSKNVNVRVGFEHGDFDLNFFVNNLTDEQTGPAGGGRAQCRDLSCSAYNQYQPLRTLNWGIPRQFGVQLAFRH